MTNHTKESFKRWFIKNDTITPGYAPNDVDPERLYDFIIKHKSYILKLIRYSESTNTFLSDYK